MGEESPRRVQVIDRLDNQTNRIRDECKGGGLTSAQASSNRSTQN